MTNPVSELRLVVTAEDWDQAVRFYRDALGLDQVADWSSPDGRVVLLDAGRATVEIIDAHQADYIDRVEVGKRVAGHIRIGLRVDDSATTSQHLVDAGAELIAAPTVTPWQSRNARLAAPAGLQLTLFTDLGET